MVKREANGEPRRWSVLGDFRFGLIQLHKLVNPPFGRNKELANFIQRLIDLLKELEGFTPDQVISALETLKKPKSAPKPVEPPHLLPEGSLADISVDEILRIVQDEKTPKDQLSRIARERFGASPGTLARLSRKALVERLEGFIESVKTHETIAMVAAGPVQR